MTRNRATGVVNRSGSGQDGGVPVALQSEPSNRQMTPIVGVGVGDGDGDGSVVVPSGVVGAGAVVVGVSEGAVGLDEPPPPHPANAALPIRTTTVTRNDLDTAASHARIRPGDFRTATAVGP